MSAPKDSNIDDAILDMLVDGELSDQERRRLLLSLDHTRDGWRRCALAFLEARTWKESLAEIPEQAPRPAAATKKARAGWPRLRTPLAMAASFLLALALGLGIDNLFKPSGAKAPPIDVASVGAVQGPSQPDVATKPFRDITPQLGGNYQYVTLPAPDAASGQSGSLELPVVPRSSLDNGWLSSVPFAVPESVVQSLQRQGHEVRQQRHVIPYVTEDGRPVMFPVDEVELQYVGNRDFQ